MLASSLSPGPGAERPRSRLGAARAPERGGDEVSAVARSFNRMADELTARAQALDISDKARRQLLADVSHELKTPVAVIQAYTELLLRRAERTGEDANTDVVRRIADQAEPYATKHGGAAARARGIGRFGR